MARPPARDRLLDQAELLFAEHGLNGVSLRAINAAADLSPAALHYHFGSKRALVEALLERHMSLLMEQRRQLLDALETSAQPPSARSVLDALVRPLAELLAREGEAGHRYLRLLSRLQADGDLDERFVLEHYRGGVDRLEPLLQRALLDLPPAVVRLRLALAIELMLRALADWQSLAGSRSDDPLSLEDLVVSLLDFLDGALEAPTQLPPTRATAERPAQGEEA